jgi:antitoxin StbD
VRAVILSTSKSASGTLHATYRALASCRKHIGTEEKPDGHVAAGRGSSVAILNRNEPAFYCIPAKEYEALMNRLDDLELVAFCKERENDPTITVSIDDL